MTVPGEKNVSSPEKIHSVDVTFAKEHAQLPRRGRVADPTREPGVREWARLEPHTASRAPDLRGAQIDIEWDVAYRGVAWRPKARARNLAIRCFVVIRIRDYAAKTPYADAPAAPRCRWPESR